MCFIALAGVYVKVLSVHRDRTLCEGSKTMMTLLNTPLQASSRTVFVVILLWSLIFASFCAVARAESSNATASPQSIQRVIQAADSIKRTDASRAIQLALTGLSQLEDSADTPEQLTLFNILAIAYLQTGELASSEKYAQNALVLSGKLQRDLAQAEALNTLGAMHWYQGDHDLAKSYFEQSLAVRMDIDDSAGLASVYNNLGVLEEIQGHYHRAIDNYLLAIDNAKRTSQQHLLARPLTNLGVVNQMLKNYNEALNYYQEALALKLELEDFPGAALAYNNISEIYREWEDYSAAETALLAGLALLDNQQAPQQLALLSVNLAAIYVELKRPLEARSLFSRTEKINNTINNPRIRMHLAQGQARLFFANNNYPEALTYATQFHTLAAAEQDQQSLKKAYYLLYQIYQATQSSAEALDALLAYSNLQETLYSQENSRYVASLQAEFENERKERELAQLREHSALSALALKRQQLFNYGTILLAIIVVLVVVLFFRARANRIQTSLLEQKVAQRTQEIQQNALTIKQLLAEKEDLLQHKNELFSVISHEFRTPLTLISGPIEFLFGNSRSQQVKDATRRIQANTHRLMRLVDQLLDLARIDQKIAPKPLLVDASRYAEFLLSNMEPLFTQRQLVLTAHIGKDCQIAVNPESLEKIMVNLVSNAIKYTAKGGEIKIELARQEDEVLFAVTDNGIGIAEADQPRIFQRFTRLETDVSKTTPGTGIGLALVKELVEHAHGEINLHSRLHEGSRFEVRFPSALIDRNSNDINIVTSQQNTYAGLDNPNTTSLVYATEIQCLSIDSDARMPLYLRPDDDDGHHECQLRESPEHTILIVDDSAEMRDFIGLCLGPHFNCLYAEDGKEGVRLALQEIPDLIVTDLMMPTTDGYQLAKILREEALTCHIPIVMLTAKGEAEARLTAWQTNIDEFIEKPFSTTELILRCNNLLNIRQLLSSRLRDQLSNDATEKSASEIQINPSDKQFLHKLHGFLENNYMENIRAREISSALCITEKQLQRKVKALTHETVPTFVRNYRLQRGAERLAAGENITRVALDVGFSSQNYFSTAFSARYGCSPTEYRKAQQAAV